MIFKNLCIPVLWMKVASVLEGLTLLRPQTQGDRFSLKISNQISMFARVCENKKFIHHCLFCHTYWLDPGFLVKKGNFFLVKSLYLIVIWPELLTSLTTNFFHFWRSVQIAEWPTVLPLTIHCLSYSWLANSIATDYSPSLTNEDQPQ